MLQVISPWRLQASHNGFAWEDLPGADFLTRYYFTQREKQYYEEGKYDRKKQKSFFAGQRWRR
jgi:hypothetical protein